MRPRNLLSYMKVTTKAPIRVWLRAPAKSDAEEFIALNRGSKRFHCSWVSPPTTVAQFARFLERSQQDDSVCLFICLAEDRRIIGAINFSQIFRGGFQNAYLGYYLGAAYAGQGFMSEALQLALAYAFKHLKLHRLEANIQPENVASLRLVKRAGFVCEGYSRRYLKVCGRWRDHERWAIIAEDWQSSIVARRDP